MPHVAVAPDAVPQIRRQQRETHPIANAQCSSPKIWALGRNVLGSAPEGAIEAMTISVHHGAPRRLVSWAETPLQGLRRQTPCSPAWALSDLVLTIWHRSASAHLQLQCYPPVSQMVALPVASCYGDGGFSGPRCSCTALLDSARSLHHEDGGCEQPPLTITSIARHGHNSGYSGWHRWRESLNTAMSPIPSRLRPCLSVPDANPPCRHDEPRRAT